MNPRFLLNGDSAVSVELGTEISVAANRRVRGLMENIERRAIEGIVELVPAYTSLMIHYRPDFLNIRQIETIVRECCKEEIKVNNKPVYIMEIPVLYGGEAGMDLDDCARIEGISREELIAIHSESDYYIYMLGFAPGHPYCARMEHPFSFKRRESPRIKVGARSVVVSAELSNILPFDQPCGWNVIGITPVELCDYSKQDPFLLEAGQWIHFVPINEKEYRVIRRETERGTYRCKVVKKAVEN